MFINKKTLYFIVIDALLIAVSVYLSFLLRFDGKIPTNDYSHLEGLIILIIIFTVPIFYVLKLYSFSWDYVSTHELVSLFKAVIFSFVLSGISVLFFRNFYYFSSFPRSTIFVSYFLIFLFCGFSRISKRIFFYNFNGSASKKGGRTLIIGAGDAGEQIVRNTSLKNNFYLPVGFLDDDSVKQDMVIHGLKVLGKINDIPTIVREYNIERFIIALPSAGSEPIRRAVKLGRQAGVAKIKVIPAISEIINGSVSIKDLKDVNVEDLLGREKISLDIKDIKKFIENNKVLVTGAAGSIGSELCRQIAKFKPSLIVLLDQDETGIFNVSKEIESDFENLKVESVVADITDSEKVNKIFKEVSPKIVFHAAAYKHVPLMEKFPDEAVKNNIFGTKNLVQASVEFGTEKFIFISTDKAVNPTSVMGATKRFGEMVCQVFNEKNKTKFVSVRFGNVLNSRGSVIPIFTEQIRKRGPVEVTHPEMKRYFMLISEACLLVMQSGAVGEGGEVFVLDMGEPVKILDLAKEMIRLSGYEPDKDIAIVFTAPRPGEKLFEEMLTAEEGTVATKNKKIFIAKSLSPEKNKLLECLDELEKAVKADNQQKIVEILKSFVPFYG